jgi:hypothetical protein
MKIAGKLLESGLMLAIAMGMAYALTYFYLAGWLDVYFMPDEYMDIGIQEMITAIYKVVYSAWPVLILPGIALLFSTKIKDSQIAFLVSLTTGLLCVVAFSVSMLHRFESINWVMIGIIGFELVESISKPLIFCRDKGSFKEKWKTYYAREEADSDELERLKKADVSAMDASEYHDFEEKRQKLSGRVMATKLGSILAWTALTVAILLVVVKTMGAAGAEDAMARENYFVSDDYPGYVIVFQTEDIFVMMERDGDQLTDNSLILRHYDPVGHFTYTHTGILLPPEGEANEE